MRTALIILLAGVSAQAQEGRGPGRGRPSPGFTALDLNNDGILDPAEIEAAPKSLSKWDKNADGQITSDEVPQGRGRGESEGGAQVNIAEEMVKTLMAFDANGDGKLSRSELPERFQGIFDRVDENKDGFLSADEIREVAVARSTPPEPAGRGGRGEMNFIRMDPILAAVDTDGDGVLSADEIRNSADAIRKLDKNGDGKVTRDEIMPAGGPRRQL